MDLLHDLSVRPGDRIAAIGAGGTTRLLSRMALDWAAAGGRPWLSTTTRLDERELLPGMLCLHLPEDRASRRALVERHASRGRHGEAVAAGIADRREGRLGGLEPLEIEDLSARWPADLLLVKADGTRGQPFKAHAEHEPSIPPKTGLAIAVVGLWVLGQPLDEDHVHRAALAAELWGYGPGEPVDEALLERALAEPEGYRRRVPAAARYAVFLNHRGEPSLVEAAGRLRARLSERGVEAHAGSLAGGGG